VQFLANSSPTAAPASEVTHGRLANAIRALAMDAVEQAKSGHPGLPMGAADVATVLFTRFLKFDAADPKWPDRDRFVLSAGHGSMMLYAVLHLLGYAGVTIDEIKRFRQMGAITAGHPDYGAAWRARDFKAVTSPEFKQALVENHIVLVHYKDLKKIM